MKGLNVRAVTNRFFTFVGFLILRINLWTTNFSYNEEDYKN